jgi:RNase P protein component
LRAVLRQQARDLKPGYDVIIQGLAGSKTASAEALREELQGFLKKAKLLP